MKYLDMLNVLKPAIELVKKLIQEKEKKEN
jgi:hypothetical protein